MNTTSVNVEELIASLEERILKLEAQVAALTPPVRSVEAAAPAPSSAVAPPEDEITPEVLAVISAAICAFLGKKARIRRVRRVYSTGMNPWAQQGRVFIQGSHNLPAHRQ
jgi:methylmalonyl-CoA carboxyltransferase large subunit